MSKDFHGTSQTAIADAPANKQGSSPASPALVAASEVAKEIRQALTNPAPTGKPNTPACFQGTEAPGRFRVTLDDTSSVVTASNRSEAWAYFCDGNQKLGYPSPKKQGIAIEYLGPGPA